MNNIICVYHCSCTKDIFVPKKEPQWIKPCERKEYNHCNSQICTTDLQGLNLEQPKISL